MNFKVKDLNDIRRILFNETVSLLKHHYLIDKKYKKKLNKPDDELLAAIEKLNSPRDTQVQFLWKLLDVLDDPSTTMGFSKRALNDNKRSIYFTGVALAILDQISVKYKVFDPSYSHLYEGLQRIIGIRSEKADDEESEEEKSEAEKEVINEIDVGSKLQLVDYTNKFLRPFVYENQALTFIRKEQPFPDREYLKALYKKLSTLALKYESESLESAEKNTLEREAQIVQQAKEKAKVAEQPAKSYFRLFGSSASPKAHNNLMQSRGEEKELESPRAATR